mgnify:CR=1 FL=1
MKKNFKQNYKLIQLVNKHGYKKAYGNGEHRHQPCGKTYQAIYDVIVQ